MRHFLTVIVITGTASLAFAAPPSLPKYPMAPVQGPQYKPATPSLPIRVVEIKPEPSDRDAKTTEVKNAR